MFQAWRFDYISYAIYWLVTNKNKNNSVWAREIWFRTVEIFLNVITKFSTLSDKTICHYSKRDWTCRHFCERPGCYNSASKTQVTDGIFKLIFHALVIYQVLRIPWIHWIHWIAVSFKENLSIFFRLRTERPQLESVSLTTYINIETILWTINKEHVSYQIGAFHSGEISVSSMLGYTRFRLHTKQGMNKDELHWSDRTHRDHPYKLITKPFNQSSPRNDPI